MTGIHSMSFDVGAVSQCAGKGWEPVVLTCVRPCLRLLPAEGERYPGCSHALRLPFRHMNTSARPGHRAGGGTFLAPGRGSAGLVSPQATVGSGEVRCSA